MQFRPVEGKTHLMTPDTLELAQSTCLPQEDLTPYAGQWVALREGYVIAADLDPISLRDNPDVRSDDALFPVPSGGTGMFLL